MSRLLTKFVNHSESLKKLSIDNKAGSKLEAEADCGSEAKLKSLDSNQQQSINDLRSMLQKAHNGLKDKLAEQRTLLETMQMDMLARYETAYIEKQRELDDCADLAVVKHLRFETITTRHEEIVEAHRRTFSWIFKDPETFRASGNRADNTRPWSNFVQWLQHGDKAYWINGKAGSGKSTLMRFIAENSETLEQLRKWAGPAELQVASFYLWNSGSPEQRSQSGLFRSLLYEILCKRRDLIRFVFEAEWEASRSLTAKFEQMSMLDRLHSLKRLKEAFAYLASLASAQFKLCFFIDGLDEYQGSDGPEAIICAVTTDILRSPYLKICLSSRPWIEFEEAFDGAPKLRLQDLTYKDIRLYVYDKLESHPRMLQLSTSHPGQTATFVSEILSKANGVFLWVYLVIKSLLDGLKYRDDILDLQRRLELIPPRLEDLYGHILNGIDKCYIGHASRIFQIYHSASDVDVRPTVLELDLAFTATYTDAMTLERMVMSEEDIQKRCDGMLAHLKVWCGGLLEAHDRLDSNWEAKEDAEDLFSRPAPTPIKPETQEVEEHDGSKIRVDAKVSYLHRTVRDYLKTDSVRAKFKGNTQTSPKSEPFDPYISLLESYLINLKRSICSFYADSRLNLDSRVWRTTNDVYHIVQKLGSGKSESVMTLLEEFNVVGRHWWLYTSMLPGSTPRSRHRRSKSDYWQEGIFHVAVRFGLCSFVQKYIQTYRMPPVLSGRSILMYALGMSSGLTGYLSLLEQPASPPMVELLLRHGENPNQDVGQHTVWEYSLKAYRTENARIANNVGRYQRWALILRSMLEYGAHITDTVAKVDPPDLAHWKFKANETTQEFNTQGYERNFDSLEVLINNLVAKAPPDAGALLRHTYLQRKQPLLQTHSSSPGSSPTPRKRPCRASRR